MQKIKQRYQAYKPTNIDWIGEIPVDWEPIRSRFVMGYKKGKNLKTPLDKKETENCFPYLSMELLRGKEDIQIEYAELDKTLVKVEDNDLLLLWDGANAGEFMKGREGLLSSTMAKFYIPKGFNIQYMYYLSKNFESILREFSIGMGIPHVNGNVLKDLTYFKFDIKEQQAIADYLDTKTAQIDQIISLKQQQIELLKERRTALINHVMTKGLNPNVEMVDSGIEWIGMIPKGWETTKIGRIVQVGQGIQVDIENQSYEKLDSGSVRFLRISDYTKGGEEERYIIDPGNRYYVLGEDVVMVRYGENAGLVVTGLEGIIANNMFFVRPNEKFLTKNFLYLFLSQDEIFNILRQGYGSAAMPQISHGIFKDLEIILPTIKEQIQIVEYINSKTTQIDQTITAVEKSIELLAEYKQSLISHVVTGKVKVF